MAVSPDRRDDMNCAGAARLAWGIGLLAAPLTGAAAGELGPTSRGTVSISITIPPHLSVLPSGRSDRDRPPGLCMAANGTREYRVAIVGPSEFPGREDILPARSGECAAATAAALAGTARTAAAGPVTLLIVPD
jgi:hypothetical protein